MESTRDRLNRWLRPHFGRLPSEFFDTLVALDEFCPFVIDGDDLPEETKASSSLMASAVIDWLDEGVELGLLNRSERNLFCCLLDKRSIIQAGVFYAK